MGQNGILIDEEQAESFARRIYMDIAAYIELHQKEYQEFLLQQKKKGDAFNEDKTTY